MSTELHDPLDRITLTPRRFAAVLSVAALLLGLVLALVPVRVANADVARPRVSCGNTFGGAETASIISGLGEDSPPMTVAYIDLCEREIGDRTTVSWALMFGGLISGVGLGVVRRRA